jgi:hypothetical protein
MFQRETLSLIANWENAVQKMTIGLRVMAPNVRKGVRMEHPLQVSLEPAAVFTRLHFLCNLQIGPVS